MEVKPQQFQTRKVVKDMKLILKDFEPMVKDPKHLWNGREISINAQQIKKEIAQIKTKT